MSLIMDESGFAVGECGQLTDDAGLLIGGYNIPLNNGWNLRYRECVGQYSVQLVDANGCPLLEGFMADVFAAAESLRGR